MRMRWRGLVLLALLPWVAASAVAHAYTALSGFSAVRMLFHDFFLTPVVVAPAVTLIACAATTAALTRVRSAEVKQHWVAGGFLALSSTVAVAGVGLAWGGAFGCYWLLSWSLTSGYWAFSWIQGALAWRDGTLVSMR